MAGWSRIRSRIRALGAPWRIGIFLVGLLLSWLPVALPLWILLPPLRDLLWIPLYIALVVGLGIWGRQIRGGQHPYGDYGLTRFGSLWPEIWLGCFWGLASLLGFFWIEGWLGWLVWQPISGSQLGVTVITGLGLGLGVSWAEELVFRGWLLVELQDDYGPRWGAWGSSLIFAVAHFLKPWQEILRTWPQFPGLVLMGWVLTYARWCSPGQLGTAIGLHGGWIWGITLINTLNWVKYTGQVPDWVTGIDGNPLAGAVGLAFLLGNSLSLWLYIRSQTSVRQGDS